MEELRSTEALDNEILEDARKKAAKALRNAEEAAKAVEREWEKKQKDDLAALEIKHGSRMAAKREETKARMPLDKRRVRAERAERVLRAAMEKTLRSLPRDRMLTLLEQELKARAGELPASALVVRRKGMSQAEAGKVLSRVSGLASFSLAPCSAAEENEKLPSLVIEGGKTTVRVGVAEAGEYLLIDHRAELATALLGTEALDD